MEPAVASSLLILLQRIDVAPAAAGGGEFTLMGEQDAKLAADLAALERHGLITITELPSYLSLGKLRHLRATLTDVGRALVRRESSTGPDHYDVRPRERT